MTPEDLRKEAAAAEFMSRLVSYRPDKEWLSAKAAELRRLADRLEARSWRTHDHDAEPEPRRRRRQ